MKLILGSSSPFRQAVLKKLGQSFDVIEPNIDEKSIRFNDPKTLVTAIANAKMDAVLLKVTEPAFVITSDQVVVSNGLIMEKPVSKEEAKEHLIQHRSIPPGTATAVCVANTSTGQRVCDVDFAKVYFSSIPDDLIDRLIADGRILISSGSFIVNDPIIDAYVDHIEGSLDSIEGLPLELVQSLLKQVGCDAL
ncbi:MAG: Maf family protein [Candidatus Uhrbacteria bacterium]|nr:Maf family protein [Candidatus Uhrbacteria bacterium]